MNKRNVKYIYVVKDLEGNELARGLTIGGLCKFIGCNKSTVSTALREGRNLILRKYLINRYSYADYYKEQRIMQKKKSKFQIECEMVKWHLDIYGNTIVWKNPTKIINELEKEGYRIDVEYRPEKKISYKEGMIIKNEILDKRWILTLIKKGE